jgi:Domain of unknown function (DUF1707)
MNDVNHGVSGSDDGMGNRTRVGTAERDKAVELLGEHWHDGRLDPAEHERRVTKARAAVTQADLDVLFADLPRTGPPQESTTAVAASGVWTSGQGRRDTMMALTPFAGPVFVLRHPAVALVLVGPRDGDPALWPRRKEVSTSTGALTGPVPRGRARAVARPRRPKSSAPHESGSGPVDARSIHAAHAAQAAQAPGLPTPGSRSRHDRPGAPARSVVSGPG